MPNQAAPRTPAVHLRDSTLLLGFISGDPKTSPTLKSVNGLHTFEAIATIGSKLMLDLGMRWVGLAKIWPFSDRPEGLRAGKHSRPERPAEISFQSGLL